MSFLFPTLLAIGLPLIAVPVLIHLINLRRQQKIRWAAMQFLVESERQNKRWILFKQWLLLGDADGGDRGVGAAARARCGAERVAAAARLRHDAPRGAGRRQLLGQRPLGEHVGLRRSEAGRRGDCRTGPSAVRFAASDAAAILRGGADSRPGLSRRFSPSRSTTIFAASSRRCSPAGNRRRPTSARPTRSRPFRDCRWRARIRR